MSFIKLSWSTQSVETNPLRLEKSRLLKNWFKYQTTNLPSDPHNLKIRKLFIYILVLRQLQIATNHLLYL